MGHAAHSAPGRREPGHAGRLAGAAPVLLTVALGLGGCGTETFDLGRPKTSALPGADGGLAPSPDGAADAAPEAAEAAPSGGGDAGELPPVGLLPCSASGECPEGLPCDPESNTCVECVTNDHCAGASDEVTAVCDTVLHRCTASCSAENPCPRPGRWPQLPRPVCDEPRELCVECREAADCGSLAIIGFDKCSFGRCVECTTDRDCGGNRPRCVRVIGFCGR